MKLDNTSIIIDFDSTFVQVEGLDELAKISLHNKANAHLNIEKIEEITNQGMAGNLPFDETLRLRIPLLSASKKDIAVLITFLQKKITTSFEQDKNFIEANASNIYIISGGFIEYVQPIVAMFGIPKENIFANSFLFDSQDNIIDFDQNNIMSQNNGKIKVVHTLKLKEKIHIIGDGFTDYQIKEAKPQSVFYLFTENIKRTSLVAKADYTIDSLQQFIQINLP